MVTYGASGSKAVAKQKKNALQRRFHIFYKSDSKVLQQRYNSGRRPAGTGPAPPPMVPKMDRYIIISLPYMVIYIYLGNWEEIVV